MDSRSLMTKLYQPTMDLAARYQEAVAGLGLRDDPEQRRAIAVLDRVARELAERHRPLTLRERLRRLLPGTPRPPPVRGAYLWGGVGRGKTFMMDLFVAALPFETKSRYHFHRLMNRVHGRLKGLANEPDPLQRVADEIAREARVLCFDEFHVSDIADAMILGRLLDALFARGVTLVATSNTPPDDLYRDGLQRQRFLPAIASLKANTEVMHVAGLTDYRLRLLEAAELWHSPLDDAAERNLARYFGQMAPDAGKGPGTLEILGRQVPVRGHGNGVAWFDFAALCGDGRSQDDYIEVARLFQTVLLAGVPVLVGQAQNEARRFIALVDEFYDRRVNLIVSAAAPIAGIYAGDRLAREFERTRSRLLEMQSVEYLAAEHRP
jgi:cell division protein ZapE